MKKLTHSVFAFALVLSLSIGISAQAEAEKPASKTAAKKTADKKAAEKLTEKIALQAQNAATVDASAKGIAPLEAGEVAKVIEDRDIAASLGTGSAGTIARDGDAMPLFKDEIVKKQEPAKEAVATVVETAVPQDTAHLLEGGKKEANVPWLRTVLAFLFVSSLIVVAASFLRKRSGIFVGKNADESTFRIRQTIPMGLKRQIISVDFEGAHLLLGVSETGMQLLYTHPQPGLAAANTVSVSTMPKDFASHLDPAAEALANMTESLSENVPPPEKSPTLSERVALAVKELKPLGGRASGDEFRPEPIEARSGDSWAKKRVH